MENTLRIRCLQQFGQPGGYFQQGRFYGAEVRQAAVRKDKEKVQLYACGQGGVQRMLIQPPGLHHHPAYPVPVYRAAEALFRHGKAHLHRR